MAIELELEDEEKIDVGAQHAVPNLWRKRHMALLTKRPDEYKRAARYSKEIIDALIEEDIECARMFYKALGIVLEKITGHPAVQGPAAPDTRGAGCKGGFETRPYLRQKRGLRRLSPEEKEQILEMHRNGVIHAEIARRIDRNQSTILMFLKKYNGREKVSA